MTNVISGDTEAILLLTALLVGGSRNDGQDVLSLPLYRDLARRLLEIEARPIDFLGPLRRDLADACRSAVDPRRILRLLDRRAQLDRARRRWEKSSTWVISGADEAYPRRLKERLKTEAPPLLFGRGSQSLLGKAGLGIVGLRNTNPDHLTYAARNAALAARAQITTLSTGTAGVDEAALEGAIAAGGYAVMIVPVSTARFRLKPQFENALAVNQFAMVSISESDSFSNADAVKANRLIYAASHAVIVVASGDRGVVWNGAIDQITKYRTTPVFVAGDTPGCAGRPALRQHGAEVWLTPSDENSLRKVLERCTQAEATQRQATVRGEFDEPQSKSTTVVGTPVDYGRPAAELLEAVGDLLRQLLVRPMTAPEVAAALRVSLPQAANWLDFFVGAGVLTIDARMSRYSLYVAEKARTEQVPGSGANAALEHKALAVALMQAVLNIVRPLLAGPMTDAEIAAALNVGLPQAKAWLKQFVDNGALVNGKWSNIYAVRKVFAL